MDDYLLNDVPYEMDGSETSAIHAKQLKEVFGLKHRNAPEEYYIIVLLLDV